MGSWGVGWVGALTPGGWGLVGGQGQPIVAGYMECHLSVVDLLLELDPMFQRMAREGQPDVEALLRRDSKQYPLPTDYQNRGVLNATCLTCGGNGP